MKISLYSIAKNIAIVLLILAYIFVSPINTVYGQEGEEELFWVAQKAFKDGFYDVAIRYIQRLLSEYPKAEKDTQAKLLLGQCYFFKSQYLKAYDTFRNLTKNKEFKDATLFWLGETFLKGVDYNQAEKHYRQVIDIFPESVYAPQALYSLGWSQFEQNNFDQAQKTFEELIQKFPDHALEEDAAFKLGESEFNKKEYQKTIEYFNAYIKKHPGSSRLADAFFYIAEANYYIGDSLTAITYYAKTADTAYDSKIVLMAKISLGWSYLKLEKLDLSEKHFNEALILAKEKGVLADDALLGLSTLYTEKKDYSKAISFYDQVINDFPQSNRLIEAMAGKANAHYLRKEYSEAIKVYKNILQKFSDQDQHKDVIEKAYFGLAWAQLKNGQIDESIKSFETIKDRSENRTIKISALTQIGDAFQDIDELQKALDVYDKILADYPDSPYTDYVQYRQGIALLKMDNVEAATLSFQTLGANFPESKYLNDIKYYLAVANFKKGDWITSRDQIQNFLNNIANDNEFSAEAFYILALSQFNLKEYETALNIFSDIIKNYPDQSAIIKNSELHIAKCLFNSDRKKEGLKKFKMLIEKYPQSDTTQEALMWLGDHYLGDGEFDQAISYYGQLISQFPGSPKIQRAFFELGQANRAKGNYDEAIESFKKVDPSEDRNLYAKAKLAIADIFSQEIEPETAVETYKNIIESSPEYKRDAFVKIAEYHKKAENYEEALKEYKQAIKSDKGLSKIENAELQFSIADCHELLNQNEKAIDEFLKIPYLYPQSISWIVRGYLHIARIFEHIEKWEEAKMIYNKIIELEVEEAKYAKERLGWIEENIILNKQ